MKFILGVDIGGTNIKFGLFDYKLRLFDKKKIYTKKYGDKNELINIIVATVKDIISRNKLTNRNILGIGFGLAGPIDFKNGIVHYLPNIPGWREVPLRRILRDKLKLKIYIDNDTNVMALAENRIGAAKKFKNVVCITLGTGIGGAISIDGNLYRGNANASGEIGHIPINENGPLCNCGGKACIEAYIGNQHIINRATKLFKKKISLEELTVLAKKKNKLACKIWQDVGKKLGIALTSVINLLNPDCIIVGGGVSGAGKILFDKVRLTVKERAMSPQSDQVRILKSALGENAGMIGAALLVKEYENLY